MAKWISYVLMYKLYPENEKRSRESKRMDDLNNREA